MNEQPQSPANRGKLGPPPQSSSPRKGGIGPPPRPPVPPAERSLRLIGQLLAKTKEGKLPWTTGFEDGQFKTMLPDGELAFVIQVKGEVRKFLMLDGRQEVILDETVPFSETVADNINYGDDKREKLYEAIGELQEIARSQALQVDDKLARAEKILAAI